MWRHSGADPFRLHHGLAADYRPLGRPDAAPVLPADRRRVRNVVLGFGMAADVERAEAVAAAGARAAVV